MRASPEPLTGPDRDKPTVASAAAAAAAVGLSRAVAGRGGDPFALATPAAFVGRWALVLLLLLLLLLLPLWVRKVLFALHFAFDAAAFITDDDRDVEGDVGD